MWWGARSLHGSLQEQFTPLPWRVNGEGGRTTPPPAATAERTACRGRTAAACSGNRMEIQQRQRLLQSSLSPASQQRMRDLFADVSPPRMGNLNASPPRPVSNTPTPPPRSTPMAPRTGLWRSVKSAPTPSPRPVSSISDSHAEDWTCPICGTDNDAESMDCGTCDYCFWECRCGALNDSECTHCDDCGRLPPIHTGSSDSSPSDGSPRGSPPLHDDSRDNAGRYNKGMGHGMGREQQGSKRRRRRGGGATAARRGATRPPTRRRPLQEWDEWGVVRATAASIGWEMPRPPSTPRSRSAPCSARKPHGTSPPWVPPGVCTLHSTWHALDKPARLIAARTSPFKLYLCD